jgi:aspartyl-tRNA synthetase
MYRSHILSQVDESLVGSEITLSGWVHRRRDHGGLIFIDLRDRYSMVQLVIDPNEDAEVHKLTESVRSEFVIKIKGTVRLRPEGNENKDITSGKVEVLVTSLDILSKAKTTPFEIDVEKDVNEELRLKYRYLDLRRDRLKNNMILRHDMIKFIRDFMCSKDFLEVETPILVKGTPEGSREYMVPSRIYPGNFYVLPQSPQQLKQLLMVAGFDRYFQIARCFRDEDQRGDRQPEFTQLDMEFSFVTDKEVMDLNETLFFELIKKFKPEANLLFEKAKRITYDFAMNTYGSDKPDLRFGLEFADVTSVFSKSEFKVFADVMSSNGVIKALKVPASADKFSRKVIDEFTEVAKIYKAKGLAYLSFVNGEIVSPIAKFMSEAELNGLKSSLELEENDMVFFAADTFDIACTSLGQVRIAVAKKLEIINENDFAVCWVTDFPMFEYSDDFNEMQAAHHPFTSPKHDQVELLDTEPYKVTSIAYDLVLNGNEIGGGSVRIHDQKLQSKVFDILGISKEDAQSRFGHILEAFEYGVPPHAGIAWGLDRLVMLFAGEPNIREVMAFPKDSKAKDLMLGAPTPMPKASLDELSIQISESK